VNSLRFGRSVWNSLRELSRGAVKSTGTPDTQVPAVAANDDALSQRDRKVQAWRQRVLLKKAFRMHSRMGNGASDHSLAVLDEFGFVIAWYDRERSTRSDDVLERHVSQFYVSADIASDMPTRHLKAALLNGNSIRRGWRLHHNGVAFWGTTTITPILLADGRLQGFSHLTHVATVAPLDCFADAVDDSNQADERLIERSLGRSSLAGSANMAAFRPKWAPQMQACA
jgi:hypothetical protein